MPMPAKTAPLMAATASMANNMRATPFALQILTTRARWHGVPLGARRAAITRQRGAKHRPRANAFARCQSQAADEFAALVSAALTNGRSHVERAPKLLDTAYGNVVTREGLRSLSKNRHRRALSARRRSATTWACDKTSQRVNVSVRTAGAGQEETAMVGTAACWR
jgi:hypothetical protein